ncbi:type II RES/Xre toxin-antitoxin system antitoxin [Vreelandella olivaria]|uniref:type II RES/Xre toxin-antitoxin system antitoxin n=1 Tax=Vreelandella olivaria TaxID=390919 RepID=UPI00201E8C64|nr:antitoxin Xre-like helix-turn-helix domain-containing protein [Halomonas olivaria]
MATAQREFRVGEKLHLSIWQFLGIPPRGPQLHEVLREGIPYQVYMKLASAVGLERQELARYVVIAPATLQRRAKAGRFKAEESDRLYRLAEVYTRTVDLFEGDLEQARQWLMKPVRGLGGRRPIEMVSTSAGTEAVFDLIGRLEHGVFA